jgi:hypothetical protein
VQARTAKLVLFFDEAGLQSKLAGAESGRVSAGTSSDNGNVINCVWQGSAPSGRKIVSRQTFDCKPDEASASKRHARFRVPERFSPWLLD